MKTVPLYGQKAAGRVVLVDDEDYDLVMQHRWNVSESPQNDIPYAITNLPMVRSRRRGGVLMHCLITGYPLTDHRDRNGLNNQRSNLRIATQGQNHANQRSRGGASIYKGVSRASSRGRWVAYIKKNGNRRSLGTFADEISAALAYDAAARQLHGAYARVNFPNREAGEAGALDYLKDADSASADTQGAGTYVPDRPGTSKYLGVAWNSQKRRWRASISTGGKCTHLGFYPSEIDAALAYDDAAPGVHGERAQRNFPDGVPQALRDQLRAEREAYQAEIIANGHRAVADANIEWWARRQPDERTCKVCGASYLSRSTRPSSYCSGACMQRAAYARRKLRDSGEAA